MKKKLINFVVHFGNQKIYYLFLAIYILLGLFVIVVSNDFKSFRFLVNQSNSMLPSFGAGSLIFVLKDDNYQPGDIISFYSQVNGKEEIITHRLMKIGGNVYITKGDANQAIDPYVVPRLVIGKVIFAIPYLGYFFTFVKTKFGIFLFILIPAIIFVGIELLKIINYIKLK